MPHLLVSLQHALSNPAAVYPVQVTELFPVSFPLPIWTCKTRRPTDRLTHGNGTVFAGTPKDQKPMTVCIGRVCVGRLFHTKFPTLADHDRVPPSASPRSRRPGSSIAFFRAPGSLRWRCWSSGSRVNDLGPRWRWNELGARWNGGFRRWKRDRKRFRTISHEEKVLDSSVWFFGLCVLSTRYWLNVSQQKRFRLEAGCPRVVP